MSRKTGKLPELAASFDAGNVTQPFADTEAFRREFDSRHTVRPDIPEYSRVLPASANRFIITGAQNATDVDEVFWPCLETAAAELGAELMVIPLRYKNPTSIWTMSQRNAERWVAEVKPYLWSKRVDLNKNLRLMADDKIAPTNSNPLGRTDAMSGHQSAIFGHYKLQMKTVPTPQHRMAKVVTTTGVCTKENYTDSGAGKISQFHHSLSAIYVEIEGDRFYMTQLHFSKSEGCITHLNRRFFPGYTGNAPRALALVEGDKHVRFQDPAVEAARQELIDQVDPEYLVFHDTLDSHANTPHHLGHPIVQQAIGAAGMDNVRKEADEALDHVFAQSSKRRPVVVVPSNHDDMLTRWVEREDWKFMSDANADFYLELARKMKKVAHYDPQVGVELPDAFGVLARERLEKQSPRTRSVIVLDRSDNFSLADVLLSMHGDKGPNGARGSRQNLRRIGTKSIIGHSHCPGIEEGCYQTGTSTFLRLEYNHGASGWLNADVLLNADGKRQVIIYVEGRYRATRS